MAPEHEIVVVHRVTARKWQPGETLAPGARPVLEGLGLWEPFLADGHSRALGTRSIWGSDAAYENDFLFSARGAGWHLDRGAFDTMLLRSLKAAEVEVTDTTAGNFDFVADCTGRAASYAAARGARRIADDHLIGAGCVVDGPHPLPYTVVEAHESGWLYSAPLPNKRHVRAWMTDPDLYSPERGETTTVLSACSQHLSPCAGEDWIAVGDAAAAFDPLSSQGILRALRMGRIAAYTIRDALRGAAGALDKYRLYIEAEYAHYRASHLRFYRQESRWPNAPFWARRHRFDGGCDVQTAV
jgi:2-polyprenyl-6-methoxyphenol hydroxylase-like FAD-dependent oxidoreductase